MPLGQQLRSRVARASRPELRNRTRRGLPALAVALCLSAAVCGSPPASGFPFEDGGEYSGDLPLEITADRLVYESDRDLYVAEGHVRVTDGRRAIEADWMAFSTRTRRGIVTGNVVVTEGDELLEARFVDFNADTMRGVVFDGRFDTGQEGFKVGAKQLRKTGEESYHLERGVFTTCRCPDEEDREPWRIVAGDADVRLGGYARVRNTTLDVLGIPTLWFPWMMFPVKTERETGVLLPEVGVSGRNGFEVGLPLFWAARHNVNVLLTPRYLQERGLQSELEIESVYGRRSETELYGAFIHDLHEDFDEGSGERPSYSPNRWAAELSSDTELPADWRLRADIHAISDNDYLDDFAGFRRFRADRFLESRAFAFRHFTGDGRISLATSAMFADDLQDLRPDREHLDRDRFLLQRLGVVSFDQLPAPLPLLPGLMTRFGAELINFYPISRPQEAGRFADYYQLPGAEDAFFVDTGVDGIWGTNDFGEYDQTDSQYVPEFQEGEPLADHGLRLVLHPRIAYPLRLWDRVELYPEVGYQETLYHSRERDFEERGLLTARLDVSTRLYRDLDLGPLPATTHLLEPKLSWALVQERDQRGNPVFVPRSRTPQRRLRLLDLDSVILDPADRIEGANILRAGLGNRFYVGGRAGGAASLRVEFDVSGAYDFWDREGARLILDGRSMLASRVRSSFALSVDPKRGRIDEGLLSLQVPLPRVPPVLARSSVGANYRYLREIPLFYDTVLRDQDRLSQFAARARIGLGKSWDLGYVGVYSIDQRDLLGNLGFVQYTSQCRCWAIRAEISDHPRRGVEFNFRYTLLGLGDKGGGAFGGGRGISMDELGRSGTGLP